MRFDTEQGEGEGDGTGMGPGPGPGLGLFRRCAGAWARARDMPSILSLVARHSRTCSGGSLGASPDSAPRDPPEERPDLRSAGEYLGEECDCNHGFGTNLQRWLVETK